MNEIDKLMEELEAVERREVQAKQSEPTARVEPKVVDDKELEGLGPKLFEGFERAKCGPIDPR